MKRKTYETEISITRSNEKITIDTKDVVLDHLLNSLFFYMGIPITIHAESDLRHHLWEDCGIAVGEFLAKEFDRGAIARFGYVIMPMDEALVLVSLDVSRTFASVELDIKEGEAGFEQGLFREFVNGLSRAFDTCIHIRQLAGLNAHHIIEAAFKGLGKSFQQALKPTEGVQSTKGSL
jgi:imidazoleglycerol-phosphate dehydratase